MFPDVSGEVKRRVSDTGLKLPHCVAISILRISHSEDRKPVDPLIAIGTVVGVID